MDEEVLAVGSGGGLLVPIIRGVRVAGCTVRRLIRNEAPPAGRTTGRKEKMREAVLMGLVMA